MIVDSLHHILKLYLGGSGPAVVYNRFIRTIPAVHCIEKRNNGTTQDNFINALSMHKMKPKGLALVQQNIKEIRLWFTDTQHSGSPASGSARKLLLRDSLRSWSPVKYLWGKKSKTHEVAQEVDHEEEELLYVSRGAWRTAALTCCEKSWSSSETEDCSCPVDQSLRTSHPKSSSLWRRGNWGTGKTERKL